MRLSPITLLLLEATAALAGNDGLPATGAPLDRTEFRYRRAIAPGPEGLTTVDLDAAVLAHSRDIGDLRIVNGAGLQIPYLLEQLDTPLILDLPPMRLVTPATRGVTRYIVDLPHARAPASRLLLCTTARVFTRHVTASIELLEERGSDEARSVSIASATWASESPGVPSEPLGLRLPAIEAPSVDIAIDDGENERLPIDRPRLELPAERLRFSRAKGDELQLLYGHPSLGAPRYDLEMLRSELSRSEATSVSLGPEESLPVPPDRLSSQRRTFWIVLAITAIGLCLLIARLVRLPEARDPEGRSDTPGI